MGQDQRSGLRAHDPSVVPNVRHVHEYTMLWRTAVAWHDMLHAAAFIMASCQPRADARLAAHLAWGRWAAGTAPAPAGSSWNAPAAHDACTGRAPAGVTLNVVSDSCTASVSGVHGDCLKHVSSAAAVLHRGTRDGPAADV